MMRTLVLAALCCAVTAVAGEAKPAAAAEPSKAAATTAEPASKAMTCGEMLKSKAAMRAKMSEMVVAAEGFFAASAEDLVPLKSKEAKAEEAVWKKAGKTHKEAAAKLKAAAEEMEKDGATLAVVPNHPPMSEKSKAAMTALMSKEKELIALMQKDVDEGEKMMKDMKESGAKAGGSR